MCYSPTARSKELIAFAKERIAEGKLENARRLLTTARPLINGRVRDTDANGLTLKEQFNEVLSALEMAEASGRHAPIEDY